MEKAGLGNVSDESVVRTAPPCAMVIFGAGGDLTKRKLIPALYNLARQKSLPDDFAIIGVSREQFSSDDFRQRTTQEINMYATGEVDQPSWEAFAKGLYYTPGDFKDPELYKKLGELLEQAEKEQNTRGNCIFYLATSPTFFPIVVQQLGAAGLTQEQNGKWKRVVIEKPFGHDLRFGRFTQS